MLSEWRCRRKITKWKHLNKTTNVDRSEDDTLDEKLLQVKFITALLTLQNS